MIEIVGEEVWEWIKKNVCVNFPLEIMVLIFIEDSSKILIIMMKGKKEKKIQK